MRILLILAVAVALAATTAAARSFDVIESAHRPYIAAGDPLGFPMKVRALSNDVYSFWRGSKDLYYAWCKSNAADWIADRETFVRQHGDLHFGNIGSYPSGQLGSESFGLVDFDESCAAPFQLELMQGIITFRLTAKHRKFFISDALDEQICTEMIDAFSMALKSKKPAEELLRDDEIVKQLLKKNRKDPYVDELEVFTKDEKFRPVILWKKGKLKDQPKDILRKVAGREDDFAAGIAAALEHSPRMKSPFRISGRDEIRQAILDIAQRTRVGSSGSQGLKKYFVLVKRPLKDVDHDLIVYLKQEIPGAGERAGVSPLEARTPGQRCSQDQDLLTDPPPLMNSWCDIKDESYWVQFKEPWSDELDPADIADFDSLLHAAKIWGTIAGASHSRDPKAEAIAAKITPDLVQLLRRRSADYLKQIKADFADLKSDPRTIELRAKADATVESFAK